jgi:hypothetical protein
MLKWHPLPQIIVMEVQVDLCTEDFNFMDYHFIFIRELKSYAHFSGIATQSLQMWRKNVWRMISSMKT